MTPSVTQSGTALSPTTTSTMAPPPTPVKGWPLVGVLPGLLRDGPGFMLETARGLPNELFSLKLGPVTVPVIYRPQDIQHVLLDHAKEFTKGGMWVATRPLLGEGLVTSDGEQWRKQRQLMQPVFTPKHLASLGTVMAKAAVTQVDDMMSRAPGPMEMGAEMTLLTQRVLFETLFGGSLEPEVARHLGTHLNTAFSTLNLRIFLYFMPSWFPLPGTRDFFHSIAEIDKGLGELVARRRANPPETSDLLSLLLNARDPETGEGMDDRLIRDQLITLFVAGLDTTAVTLTWLLHLLDAHPDVDQRLRQEVRDVVGDRTPAVEDLPRLTYTRQVIQETMRMYPPAWIFPRFAEHGAEINGRRVEPGASLLISPWLTHRDPQHWEDPDRFDPERFTADKVAARPRHTYIPFGVGGRQCIGNHFAMMEAQLATVALVQRMRAKQVPGPAPVPMAASTLKPKGGLHMTISPV